MKVNLLGVLIDNVSFEEATEKVRGLLLQGERAVVVTPNPEFVVRAQRDLVFRDFLNEATLAIPDGVGLIWASRVLGQPLRGRVTGADLAEKAVEIASESGKSVFFLGGAGDSAARAAESMKKHYPGLRIAGVWAGKGSPDGDEEAQLKIGQDKVGLLLVAFGAPKQEMWLKRNLPNLQVNVAMGVGGTFDYWSGRIGRAPKLVRSLGLEWAYRLIREPWRIRRQLALPQFVWLTLKARF